MIGGLSSSSILVIPSTIGGTSVARHSRGYPGLLLPKARDQKLKSNPIDRERKKKRQMNPDTKIHETYRIPPKGWPTFQQAGGFPPRSPGDASLRFAGVQTQQHNSLSRKKKSKRSTKITSKPPQNGIQTSKHGRSIKPAFHDALRKTKSQTHKATPGARIH